MTDAEKIEALMEHVDKLESENAGIRADVRAARDAEDVAVKLSELYEDAANRYEAQGKALTATLESQKEYAAGRASRDAEVAQLTINGINGKTLGARWERLARKYAKALNTIYHTVNMQDAFGYREDGPITVDGGLQEL